MSEPITVELRVLGHSFRLVTTEKEKALPKNWGFPKEHFTEKLKNTI